MFTDSVIDEPHSSLHQLVCYLYLYKFTEMSIYQTASHIYYLQVQVFADMLLQEGPAEDGADRGPVPGADLK